MPIVAFAPRLIELTSSDRASYFAKLVRDAYDAFMKQRERERRAAQQRECLALSVDRVHDADAANAADPVAWLRKGLDLVATQWPDPTT